MNLVVRRADGKDLDAIAPLFDAYRQFYQQPSDVDAARVFLAERTARDESVVLVAEAESDAIGFVQLYPVFSSVRLGRTWLLNDLYVAPQARQFGVGRALLDAACAFARERGALSLELETGNDNATAQALYRSAGWQLGENLHFHIDFAHDDARDDA